jgi:hypothetical protein
MPKAKVVKQNIYGFSEGPPMGTLGHVLVVGRTGSGKTHWVSEYLRSKFCTADKVIVVSPRAGLTQPAWLAVEKYYRTTSEDGEVHNHCILLALEEADTASKLPEMITANKAKGFHTICIFDDLLMYMKSDKLPLRKVADQLILDARHQQCQIWSLQQQLFDSRRMTRLQYTYFVLFKVQTDEIRRWASQACDQGSKACSVLVDVYKRILQQGEHRCMICDTSGRSTKQCPLAIRDTHVDCLVPQLWDIF